MARLAFSIKLVFVLASFGRSVASEELCPCENNGLCTYPSNERGVSTTAICQCKPGFTGPLCESSVSSDCGTFECNNETCNLIDDVPTCLCPDGFTGSNCSDVSTSCNTDVCSGHGTCHIDSNATSGLTCSCDPGYTGATCHISLNNCPRNQCSPSMTCFVHEKGYKCTCHEGTPGDRCSFTDICAKCKVNDYCLYTAGKTQCIPSSSGYDPDSRIWQHCLSTIMIILFVSWFSNRRRRRRGVWCSVAT